MTSENRSFGEEISGSRQFGYGFTPEQWAAIVAEIRAGKSQRQVAKDYNTTQRAISKTKRRWDNNHNNASRPRKGRPGSSRPYRLS
ncbi:hypothetical protein B0T10DRAFT_499828, partial [Thelonectria olida]